MFIEKHIIGTHKRAINPMSHFAHSDIDESWYKNQKSSRTKKAFRFRYLHKLHDLIVSTQSLFLPK